MWIAPQTRVSTGAIFLHCPKLGMCFLFFVPLQDVTSTLEYILSDQIKASRVGVSDSPLTPPKSEVWRSQDQSCTSPQNTRLPMVHSSCAPPEHTSIDAGTYGDEGRGSGDADMLWEYDLREDASVGSKCGGELSSEEYEALLIEMQRALYEDLQGEVHSEILISDNVTSRKLYVLQCLCHACT